MASTVFTIANQKGGVGKTTTAINLSAAMADKGIPTLVIDLDPQANATSGFGLEKTPGMSLYGPLTGEGRAMDKIQTTGLANLDIIASEVDLAAIEIELSQTENYLVQLREILAPVRDADKYRAIILDCPPALGMISMNGLAFADYLLIALQCEYLAMEGLGQILQVLEQLREAQINPNLELGGIIMTMFDVRTTLCNQVVNEVRGHFADKVFRSLIPRTIRLGEAPSFGKTIFQHDALSSGARAYQYLADEVISRFKLSA